MSLTAELTPNNHYDVVFGSGRKYDSHYGNQCFNAIVAGILSTYESSPKLGKTSIIDEILKYFKSRSPTGGFVRLDFQKCSFYPVSDHYAREKISQVFRDLLDSQYKSSKIARKVRRTAARKNGGSNNIEPFLNSGVPSHDDFCSIIKVEECAPFAISSNVLYAEFESTEIKKEVSDMKNLQCDDFLHDNDLCESFHISDNLIDQTPPASYLCSLFEESETTSSQEVDGDDYYPLPFHYMVEFHQHITRV